MNKWVAAVALIIVFIFMFLTAVYMHPFGEPENQDMDQYMIENAQNETGANNVVTSVVFDYRGYDTLGEGTVLFTAVMGVLVVYKKTRKSGES